MTLSIISQNGIVLNYSNAVESIEMVENEDENIFGFTVFLNGEKENFIVVAEYEDVKIFNKVKKKFIQWLSDGIEPVFVFPS